MVLVILVGFVRAEDTKEIVIKSAKELKGIKAKKITWKKDGQRWFFIPTSSDQMKPFWMDTIEVTVGQLKKFLVATDYQFDADLWNDFMRVPLV